MTTTLRSLARTLLPQRIRQFIRRLPGLRGTPASTECRIIGNDIAPTLMHGWQAPTLALRQYQAFAPLLTAMRQGLPREDFKALAQAVEATGMTDPLIVEVGCGSGWNAEVLAYLLHRPVRYIGMDYSRAMVKLGQQHYSALSFVTGDATTLPFKDDACDILVSGTVLMHILEYQLAIAESRRVARYWCIFHTVPIVLHRPTTILRKRAYGEPVVEIVFSEVEFCRIIQKEHMDIVAVFESVDYNLESVIGETTTTKTFVCKVR